MENDLEDEIIEEEQQAELFAYLRVRRAGRVGPCCFTICVVDVGAVELCGVDVQCEVLHWAGSWALPRLNTVSLFEQSVFEVCI